MRSASGRSVFPAFFLLLPLLMMPACGQGDSGQVTISGKTVYMGMAIEDVPVLVLRKEGDRWRPCTAGRSGYHGAFAAKVLPGKIRLEAKGEIFKGSGMITLAGQVDELDIPAGIRRFDRIVIELAPVPDNTGSGASRRPSSR